MADILLGQNLVNVLNPVEMVRGFGFEIVQILVLSTEVEIALAMVTTLRFYSVMFIIVRYTEVILCGRILLRVRHLAEEVLGIETELVRTLFQCMMEKTAQILARISSLKNVTSIRARYTEVLLLGQTSQLVPKLAGMEQECEIGRAVILLRSTGAGTARGNLKK